MDKIFNKPFAVNGARVEIPENGTENERVSFDKGFTQPYEVEAPSVDNPGGQGFNILRPEMNEALYQLSNACNLLAENIDKWTLLTTENLNDIKQAGRYCQKYNAYATDGNNYPADTAGYLIVLNTRINWWAVTQIYKAWNSERIYIRRTTSETEWSNWDSLVLTSEFNSKITNLQNTDTNLNNNKEDKTFYHTKNLTNINAVKDNRFYSHTINTANAFSGVTNYIFNIGAENGAWVRQISYPCSSNEIGVRRTLTKNDINSWGEWDSVALKSFTNSTYRKIADSYTKSEVDNKLIGINQSWQKPSRLNNTQYTNNTGKPIMVAITLKLAHEHERGTCDFYVNNLIIASEYQHYIHIARRTFSFIVPNGATYKVNCTGDFSIYLWAELR